MLTGILTPAKAYAGFANGTILLIVVAFLIARAVVKCGLGERLGHRVVSLFGRSTLGLSYSIFLVDGIIAPAFPSNTARSGVLYSLAFSLAEAAGAKPGNKDRRRLGSFLMFSGIASLTLSSALWLTAMGANPIGVEMARSFGVEISFGSWLVAASVPALAGMLLLPPLLYKVMAPEVTATPQAQAAARKALEALGPLRQEEKIVTGTFAGMVALWASSATLKLDATAVAFLGLGVLLATGVLTLEDITKDLFVSQAAQLMAHAGRALMRRCSRRASSPMSSPPSGRREHRPTAPSRALGDRPRAPRDDVGAGPLLPGERRPQGPRARLSTRHPRA